MFGIKKRKALSWSAIFSLVLLTACSSKVKNIEISGETQGTTYQIIVVGTDVDIQKEEIDEIFKGFDASLSTYVKSSVISKLNANQNQVTVKDPSGYFKECYELSSDIFDKTNGLFDPSVFPLVKGWGFMENMESPLTKNEVDSILQFVSFEKDEHHNISFNGDAISIKKTPQFRIDFNAIAQGLSVDVIDEFLSSKGCENYYIEIGGEVRVRGTNREGEKWRIGVDSPIQKEGERTLENIIHISDKGIATSGNYRKFYVKDGVKYAHTLNPKTGYPVEHSLLSATVIAETTAKADAYATAFMVMGTEKALQFVEEHLDEKLEVYLLYADEDGELQRAMSPGFKNFLK